MAHPAFFTDGSAVAWNAGGATFRLTETEVAWMLDIFERERAPELFHLLYDAHLAAGGVPRASSLIAKAA